MIKVTGAGSLEDRLLRLEQSLNFSEAVLAFPAVGNETAAAGGTLTSVAGGVGITNSPEPIVASGTVDLDLNSLTTETVSASGDLFGMVDVSVGATIAAQRKITRANVLGTGLEQFRALTVTRGDLLVGNSTPAWADLALGAADRFLGSDGTDAAWTAPGALTKVDDTNVTLALGGTPTTALLRAASLTLGWTGTLAIARGGTGAGTALAAFNALSPLTTRGDLLTRDASNNIRLAIGAANTFLKTNGTDPAWTAGAALTKVDDTNVTATLGGSATTALVNAASITLGWTGQLALARGGTGINAASNTDLFNQIDPLTTRGDLLTRDATNSIRLAVGTADQVLRTDGTDASWAKLVRANTGANTGTGDTFVFQTAPTFVTSIIAPIVYGSASSPGGGTWRANDDDFLGTVAIDSTQNWWTNMPDFAAATTASQHGAQFSPTFTGTPDTGIMHNWRGLTLEPVVTSAITTAFSTGALSMQGLRFSPTVTMAQNAQIMAVFGGGTYTSSTVQFLGTFQLFTGSPTLVSQTAGIGPYGPVIFNASPAVTYDINNGGNANLGEVLGLLCSGTATCAQGGTSQLTITEWNAIRATGAFVETAGTLLITTRRGLKYQPIVPTNSPAVTTDVCIDIENTDVAVVGDALSIRSAGATVEMRHAGPGRFGSSSAGPTGGSILHVDGGYTVKRTTFSNAAYTMLVTDYYVGQIGTMSASRTVTLPAVATAAIGKYYIIKDASGSVTGANDIVVDGSGAELIDGAATKTIDSAYGSLTLVCDGTGWQVVAHEGTIV